MERFLFVADLRTAWLFGSTDVMESQTVVTLEGNRTFNLLNGEITHLQFAPDGFFLSQTEFFRNLFSLMLSWLIHFQHINIFYIEDKSLNIFAQ